jgi:hypothetical protein
MTNGLKPRLFCGLVSLLALVWLINVKATQAETQYGLTSGMPITMLQTQAYRGGELQMNFSKKGLSFCGTAQGKARLTPGSVSFNDVEGITGTEKQAMIQGCNSAAFEAPWFFFPGQPPHLTAGPVQTLSAPQYGDGGAGFWFLETPEAMMLNSNHTAPVNFTLDGRDYALQYVFHPPSTYTIVLTSGNQQQVLVSRKNTTDEQGYANLKWVGDLDGDRHLDMIMSFNDGGTAGKDEFPNEITVLFLSSFAKPGDLVAPVSRHVATTGC